MNRTIVVAAFSLLLAACGLPTETSDEPGTTVVAAADATTTSTVATTTSTTVDLPAPVDLEPGWVEPQLLQSDVPKILTEQWSAAENRSWCSALFPVDAESLAPDAAIRSAYFGGGWAVAWDLPVGPGRAASGEYCPDCGRGAYGIAGTGGSAWGDEADGWPSVVEMSDGSKVGYGIEGDASPDSGAPMLAHLLVKEEGCLYNVWSFLGEEHLLDLLGRLRNVQGLQGTPTQWQSELPQPDAVDLGDPPWDQPALLLAVVPSIPEDEWAEAGSPSTCPMLYFADLGDAGGAAIRAAENSGEMLVAWDLGDGPGHNGDSTPCADCGRGVVGLGTFQSSSHTGPVAYTWSDGSEARLRTGPYSYGVEAFVSVEGFDCDYWIWTHLGDDHLVYLMSQLRRVENSP